MCAFWRAANDPKLFDYLVNTMAKNKAQGHFTIVGCTHNPPCHLPSDEIMNDLFDRLHDAIMKKHESSKAPKTPKDKKNK